MINFDNALIVGVGSIGYKHVKFLNSISTNLFLVDPIFANPNGRKILKEFEPCQHYKNLVDIRVKFKKNDLAVISNWGPDHFNTMMSLISLGFKNFILEKPCTDSLIEIESLLSVAQKKELKISVNQGWYYDKLGSRINQISENLQIGEAEAIFIAGGARCISTAGSHWLSLANQIFLTNPDWIFSEAKNDLINPRSSNLSYYEGIFSFTYPNFKRLSISLTNRSSISGRTEIYWRDAVGSLSANEINIYARDEFPVKNPITRYGLATKLIHREFLGSIEDSFFNLYNVFQNQNQNQFNVDLKNHLNVNKAIIYALISAEKGKRIKFNEKIKNEFYTRKFKIS